MSVSPLNGYFGLSQLRGKILQNCDNIMDRIDFSMAERQIISFAFLNFRQNGIVLSAFVKLNHSTLLSKLLLENMIK